MVIILAACIAFVWIPLDVETGAFEQVRRRVAIGDAFAPLLATSVLGLGGVLVIVENARQRRSTKLSATNLGYAVGLFMAFVFFTLILMWAGPVLVAMFGPEGANYRSLRDTVPWKYTGFILAGTALVAGIIGFVERRLSWQSIVIGLLATGVMILIYDLPFENLLLPPNGDF